MSSAPVSVWWRATRAFSLTAVLAPFVAIALFGWSLHASWHVAAALCAALGVSALLFGVNMANDVEDDARGIDTKGSLGGSGVLQAGLLTKAQVRAAAYTLMAAGVALGIPTVRAAPREMLAVGALTLFGAAMYSNRFFGLKYHALGDAAVFALCGPMLAYGASVAGFARVLPGAIALGSVFGFAAVAILHVNNLQDIVSDRRAGAFTVANVIGERASRAYLVLLYLGAALSWAILHLPLAAMLIGFVGFIPAARLIVRVGRAPHLRAPAFSLVRVEAAQAHLAIGASVCLALLFVTVTGGGTP